MRSWVVIGLAACVVAAGCAGVLRKQYEYEEELFLALDGSATLNVNASVAALVALRGADLNTDPRSRFDRDRLQKFFEGSGVTLNAVSSSRRFGRRFVHVSLAVADVRALPRLAPFAWSTYRFDRDGDLFDFRQAITASANHPLPDVGWKGTELVGFRVHLPSKIPFHNAPSHEIERGNILVWEQPLAERLRGAPIDIQVQMEAQSILARTLLLFGVTAVAALATLAGVVWWVSRRGRDVDVDMQPTAGGPPAPV